MRQVPTARTALGILTGINLLNYVDRYIPAGALPLILASFGASDSQGGLLQSLFMLPYALISPLVGNLGDRRPRFPLAGLGVLVWSLATFGSGLAPTFGLLLVARVVIGVGEASYTVVTPSLLGDYYPSERRGRVLAIFYAAIPVGSAIGFVVGSAVGTHLGWRWAFYLAGVPGAILALALFLFRDPPRGALDPDRAPGQATARDLTPPALPFATALRMLVARRSYLFNVAAQTVYTFAMGGLAAWMPTFFFRERGLPLAEAGIIFGGIVCLSGFIGTLVGGQLGDRLAVRAPTGAFLFSGVALVLSLPFSMLAILARSPAIFWPGMFMTLMLLFLNTGPLNAAMANVLPATVRSRGFGLSTMSIHLLGDALSPVLIGRASDRLGGRLELPILFTSMLLVLSGLLLLAGRAALRRDLAAAAAVGAPAPAPAGGGHA
jgi:MFS family permease